MLALQLRFRSEMRLARCGLMGASEDGPCDDMCGWNTSLREFYGEAADFLDRPPDELRRDGDNVFFGVAVLA